MIHRVSLAGDWEFHLDPEKRGYEEGFPLRSFTDRMPLPGTVSEFQKSPYSDREEVGHLTDPYHYEGFAWFSRLWEGVPAGDQDVYLVLERTRTSQVWVDGHRVGTENSLCSSHRYRLTEFLRPGPQRFTILVDNTACPVPGGHMTSPDTQTNWIGITGRIELEFRPLPRVEGVRIFSNLEKPGLQGPEITIEAFLTGTEPKDATVRVRSGEGRVEGLWRQSLRPGPNSFTVEGATSLRLWSEHDPTVYDLEIALEGTQETVTVPFGLRNFRASGTHFSINGQKAFLRGKHDGMIFPLTGYAPTDVESWLKVMGQSKAYGINHYRFHTCCPPEAAFIAADRLGIYMEPEVPFWGTVTREGDKDHNAEAQQFLVREGLRILDEFGNHPSFVMMSLGNELWGNKVRLNEILGNYKRHDPRPLYTQGSNNFQWVPDLLENEDFFCGVRLSGSRLFRGSYAMCDSPQGHIQTAAPNRSHNYDPLIRPEVTPTVTGSGGEITIQYGTGTKTVAAEGAKEFLPKVPVVSHEIGQYCMSPDFGEISRYTGVLKARNFEVFRRRLEAAGMAAKAQEFFQASGRFAAECYKAELEAALRSEELAGFQLLDLQDFSGQGTALVGVLNAFMESKGIITPEEWRQSCSDTVLLAEFDSFVLGSGDQVPLGLKLTRFRPGSLKNPQIGIRLIDPQAPSIPVWESVVPVRGEFTQGVFHLGRWSVPLPLVDRPQPFELRLTVEGTSITNHYDWWCYPSRPAGRRVPEEEVRWIETHRLEEAINALDQGRTVLFFPTDLDPTNSIEGTYCTDFWCYPMFCSISDWMKKPRPIGTLGLWIDQAHPALAGFPTPSWSSPGWYDVVSHSRALILDGTTIEPLVWAIDNFERNHRLGLIFEIAVGNGRLLVCTADLGALPDSLPAQALLQSLRDYLAGPPNREIPAIDREEFLGLWAARDQAQPKA